MGTRPPRLGAPACLGEEPFPSINTAGLKSSERFKLQLCQQGHPWVQSHTQEAVQNPLLRGHLDEGKASGAEEGGFDRCVAFSRPSAG